MINRKLIAAMATLACCASSNLFAVTNATNLAPEDWANLCTGQSTNITAGCKPSCATTNSIACQRVLSSTHAAATDGIPSSVPNGDMYVRAVTPPSSFPNNFGPTLTQTTGGLVNCTLYDSSGWLIPNRGTYVSGSANPEVTQFVNSQPSSGGTPYNHYYNGSKNAFPLFQNTDSVPLQTYYIICLGYTETNGVITNGTVGDTSAVWGSAP